MSLMHTASCRLEAEPRYKLKISKAEKMKVFNGATFDTLILRDPLLPKRLLCRANDRVV
jgi:hypothetical protein